MNSEIQDVTEEVSNEIVTCGVVVAHQKGKNVLILKKDDRPHKRFDGKQGAYLLEYRWLSDPRSVHCVQGSEETVWQHAEVRAALNGVERGKSLFDFFQLF